MTHIKKYLASTCRLLIILGGLALVMPSVVSAQQQYSEISFTAQPTKWDIQGLPSLINGYGNARFGMNEEQVRSIIATDYPLALPGLKAELYAANHTPVMSIVVNELAPGPGPATVTYVFGANSRKLIAVNVYWLATGVASLAQQQLLTEAASVVTADLLGYRWPMLQVSRGIVPTPGVLLVFSGKDFAGGGVEVRLSGVSMDIEVPNTVAGSAAARQHRVAPPGPAQLHLSYVASVENPDIF